MSYFEYKNPVKPILSSEFMHEIKRAIENNVLIPLNKYIESNPGGGDPLVIYKAIEIDSVDNLTTYIGYSKINTDSSLANWKIVKVVETDEKSILTWANGNQLFDKIWDNRLSYTYS